MDRSQVFRKLAVLSALAMAVGQASGHISPTVELTTHGDAMRDLLPRARTFTVRELVPSREQRRALWKRFGLRPPGDAHRIFTGRDAEGTAVGIVLFVTAESNHGPVEMAVAMDRSRTVVGAEVTRTQAEPLPWVRAVLDAGVLDALRGASVAAGADGLARGDLSSLNPIERYYASVLRGGVFQALALREVLDPPPAP